MGKCNKNNYEGNEGGKETHQDVVTTPSSKQDMSSNLLKRRRMEEEEFMSAGKSLQL